MKRMLINATQRDELRVAIIHGPQLVDLDTENPQQEQKLSSICKGTVSSVEPSLEAVFVNYGSERHGFLPLKEISREYFLDQSPEQLANPDINRVIKIGQELVVQVEKEERGTKGAALTTFISLPGSFLVLMPNNPRAGGISRRIDGEDRDELRDALSQLTIPEGMGVIVRTAGVGRSKEELQWDLNILLQYWEGIKQAAIAKPAPYLIHQESNVIMRAIRDHLRQDVTEIIIDEQEAYQQAHHYLSQARPDFIDKLKLYQDNLPLFSRFQIEQQIETAHQREIRLPSGGALVIDHTEALTSIDINSARATKGGSIEETALNTNLEAAEEIARQLRLRDIGGLIVIDFIDMTSIKNQREIENALRNALRLDRARVQIGRISRFGLLEMSRQRLRGSLMMSSQMPCPRCEGQGTIRRVESLAMSIIHLIQEQATRNKHINFQIQLPLEVASYMTNEKRALLTEIEQECQVKITVIPNEHLQTPHYQLRQIKMDASNIDYDKNAPSYKAIKSQQIENAPARRTNFRQDEPVIRQFVNAPLDAPPPIPPAARKSSQSGLIKRLWDSMFGASAPAENTQPVTEQTHRPDYRQSGQSGYRRPYNNRYNNSGGGHYRNRGRRGGQRNAPRANNPQATRENDLP